MKLLYTNIRKIREQLGMSQEELAKKVGYKSRTSIAKIEAGKVDLSNSKIEEFAKALGVLVPDLTAWNGTHAEELFECNRMANGKDGLIAILNDIYGSAKMEEVVGELGCCFYFPLDDEFALSEHDFDKLYDMIKPTIKQFADLMKVNKTNQLKNCYSTVNSNCNTIKIPDYAELNAAHARTDIDIPEGVDTSENDIMDAEDF